MSQHNEVGKIGEDLAREYLIEQGYKIMEQNYKTKYAEIDLVALGRSRTGEAQKPGNFLSKPELIFVEVRTKIGEKFGTPEDTINKAKLWKVLQNAKSYMGFAKWEGPARIDAVCIVLRPDFSVLRLTHHENIIAG